MEYSAPLSADLSAVAALATAGETAGRGNPHAALGRRRAVQAWGALAHAAHLRRTIAGLQRRPDADADALAAAVLALAGLHAPPRLPVTSGAPGQRRTVPLANAGQIVARAIRKARRGCPGCAVCDAAAALAVRLAVPRPRR